MTKKAISVTLSPESLQYVRAKALREKRRSVSDALDALIRSAMNKDAKEARPRSVVGTIAARGDIDEQELDRAVRAWFESGVGESPKRPRNAPKRPRRRS